MTPAATTWPRRLLSGRLRPLCKGRPSETKAGTQRRLEEAVGKKALQRHDDTLAEAPDAVARRRGRVGEHLGDQSRHSLGARRACLLGLLTGLPAREGIAIGVARGAARDAAPACEPAGVSARLDHYDANAEASHLEAQRLAHSLDREFAGAVETAERGAEYAAKRADIDDAAAALPAHMR